MGSGYRLTTGERIFRFFNTIFLLLLGFITLYPFWYVIQASLSDPIHRIRYFWPMELYATNYLIVFMTEGIGRAYLITILRVVVAVPLMIIVTASAAFALTRKNLVGRKVIILYYFITMFVSGGLIPMYMLLKTVGLLNTFGVYIFPTLFSVWTMIVMKTSFQGLPYGLVEAAIIDGAGYIKIFYSIILPLSMPMVVTLALFSAVGHWNDWFTGAFFVSNTKLRPLQTFLRFTVLVTDAAAGLAGTVRSDPTVISEDPRVIAGIMKVTLESLRLAYIVVSTVPVMLIYPFVQKYFIKGVLIGSIKE